MLSILFVNANVHRTPRRVLLRLHDALRVSIAENTAVVALAAPSPANPGFTASSSLTQSNRQISNCPTLTPKPTASCTYTHPSHPIKPSPTASCPQPNPHIQSHRQLSLNPTLTPNQTARYPPAQPSHPITPPAVPAHIPYTQSNHQLSVHPSLTPNQTVSCPYTHPLHPVIPPAVHLPIPYTQSHRQLSLHPSHTPNQTTSCLLQKVPQPLHQLRRLRHADDQGNVNMTATSSTAFAPTFAQHVAYYVAHYVCFQRHPPHLAPHLHDALHNMPFVTWAPPSMRSTCFPPLNRIIVGSAST